VPAHVDGDRGVVGAVLHRVADQVAQRLREPRRVPPASLLAVRVDPDLVPRVGRPHLGHDLAHDRAQLRLGAHDRDARPPDGSA
jgi:hypothetical protein